MTVAPIKKADKTAIAQEPKQLNIIEQALIGLAGVCDGAHSPDKVGFNGTDSQFGKSLAAQIKAGRSLTFKQAEGAIKMLKKYAKQLKTMGLAAPGVEDFNALYPNPNRVEMTETVANHEAENPTIDKRVALLPGEHPDLMIAVFGLPENPPADELRRIEKLGGKYRPIDKSWRFPCLEIYRLDLHFPEPQFTHDENFKIHFDAKYSILAQQLTKRVEILSSAHPDEMVALYAPLNDTATLNAVIKLKAHYVSDDQSWRFPLSAIESVRGAFPSPEYHHSDSFLKEFEPIDCGF